MTLYTYGKFEIDSTKLPEASIEALVRRGISHLLGNEQAAKVSKSSAWFTKFQKENGREPNEAEIETKKAEAQAAAFTQLLNGEIGQNMHGPRLDPVTAMVRTLAKAAIVATLKGANISVPKGMDIKIAFRNGTAWTMDELIERRLAHPEFGPALQKEAEKRVLDEKRKAEKARLEAQKRKEAGQIDNAEDLGL